jgi:hypothetical protein
MRLWQEVKRMSGEMPGAYQGSQGSRENDGGCAFVLDGKGVLDGTGGGPGPANFCNAPRQLGSAYCPPHHASCHLPNGSAAEHRQLREIEALAKAVGGTQGRAARHPPAHLLRRLDRVARAFSRPQRSCFVLRSADGDATER